MFADEVFVFTPKGDVINLPAGRHPHRLCLCHPLRRGQPHGGRQGQQPHRAHSTTMLHNGDIVEVITCPVRQGPQPRLAEDRCVPARPSSKIRQWFKKERREENIVRTAATRFEPGSCSARR